jgi:type VI secretion system protein ImpG
VNLFSTRAEPIRLTHTETEYHVKVRERRNDAFEIYSINRVVATSPDNEVVEYHPFYCVQHAASQMQKRAFWYAVRRPAGYQQGKDVGGTELYLSLVNLGFQPNVPADWTLEIETTCLNRDLPRALPFGGGKPKLQAALGPPMEIKCLTRPTATLRPALRQGARWRAISHLSLNHLSLIDNAEGADALREMLKLYDFSDSADTQRTIDGVASVQYRPIVRRFSWSGPSTICRGSEVIVDLDEEKITSGCVYLLASVLERFFALYSSINSFTSLVARSTQREGVIRKWDPRAGEKALL